MRCTPCVAATASSAVHSIFEIGLLIGKTIGRLQPSPAARSTSGVKMRPAPGGGGGRHVTACCHAPCHGLHPSPQTPNLNPTPSQCSSSRRVPNPPARPSSTVGRTSRTTSSSVAPSCSPLPPLLLPPRRAKRATCAGVPCLLVVMRPFASSTQNCAAAASGDNPWRSIPGGK